LPPNGEQRNVYDVSLTSLV